MITRCPYCGHELTRPIQNGIKSCTKCRCFFETDRINRLLGAAWELRKSTNMCLDAFQFRTKLSKEEANFVHRHVVDEGYTHDEFFRLLKDQEKMTA